MPGSDSGWPGCPRSGQSQGLRGRGSVRSVTGRAGPAEVGVPVRDQARLTPLALHRAPLVSRRHGQLLGECRRPRQARPRCPPCLQPGLPLPQSGGPRAESLCLPWLRSPGAEHGSLPTAEGPGRLLALQHTSPGDSHLLPSPSALPFMGTRCPCVPLTLRGQKGCAVRHTYVLTPQLSRARQ